MRTHRWVLLGLLIIAFVLRVAHNSYLLPPVFEYPNEIPKRRATLALMKNKFNHGPAQPSFLLDSMFLLYYPARAIHAWGHENASSIKVFALEEPEYLLWVGRLYMAVFGTLAVWVAYLLGKRLGSRRIGIFSAAILTFVPIHVLGSRHMKEDMPLGLFCTVAVLFMVDMIRRGATRDYLRAGLMVGVCFGTKWLGLVMVVPMVVAHFLRRQKDFSAKRVETEASNPAALPPPRRRIGLALMMILAGFFLASPDHLIRPDVVLKGLREGSEKSMSAHSDGISISAWDEAFTDYFRTGIWPGLTPSVVVLIAIGWLSLRTRRPAIATLIGFWIVMFYVLLELAKARPYPHFQRYLQPIIPSLAVLAGCGVEAVIQFLSAKPGLRRFATSILGVVIVACAAVAWPAADSLRYLHQIPRSTIIQCYNYLENELPRGSHILNDRYGPLVDQKKFSNFGYRDRDELSFGRFPAEACYVLYSSMGFGRFMEHPEANPEITRFVHYLVSNGNLVAEWKPPFKSFYCESPTIRIYRFLGSEEPFMTDPSKISRIERSNEFENRAGGGN